MENEAMETGAKEQEAAEPAVAEMEREAEAPEKHTQTAEENARYASIRRRAEAEAQKRVDEVCRRRYMGKTNPETGKAVETEADANAYEEAAARQWNQPGPMELRLSQSLREIKALRDGAAHEQFTRSQLEQLRQAFPDCGVTAENMPEELGRRWAAIGNLTDAYRLLHFDELQEQKAAAARQRALNEMRGMRQLRLEQAGSQGTEVSEGDLRTLRRMMPGKSDRELRAMLLKVN